MEKGNPVDLIADVIHANSDLSYAKCTDIAEFLAEKLHDDGWLLIHSWARSVVDDENFYIGKVWEG